MTPARWKRYKQRLDVLTVTLGRCWYCGVELDINTFHIDHLHPRSKGGGEGENLVPACYRCNCSKHARTLEEYREHVARKRAEIPWFSQKQRDWLEAQGFRFPELPPVVFWFETEGL